MQIKKSKIYKRLFVTNILVTIFLIITLDIYFINNVLENNRNSKIYVNEKVVYDVNEAINKINNSSDIIVKNMYSDINVVQDILLFMKNDTISYLENKLDMLSESNNYYYNGIERFVRLSFNLNNNLEEISFIGYDNLKRSSFNRKNQITIENINKEEFLMKKGSNNIITDKNTIKFIREIKDPVNFKNEGIIILTYNLNNIKNIVNKYEDEHQVMIFDINGYIVYNSNDEFNYEKYKYYDEIEKADQDVKLDEKQYISKKINDTEILSVSLILKSNVNKIPMVVINSLIFVDCLLLISSLSILYIKLKLLSDRTNNILVAMEKVKNGHLEVEIPITSDNDEINYISENFNEMCKELNKYIKKIYLAEIDQKKSEMIALQNQINPHFLYNTLESIRMKAICNGDKEVGKMLYTLSFLFRKQVKDNNIITIKDELEYCSKYIEIFKIRYYDKFNFEIDCPSYLENCSIVKFTIQPLIENYFVHGIRLEDHDNLLKVKVIRENGNILIKIIDNGRGISDNDLEKINYNLLHREQLGNSIGITNVNERTINQYGQGYGVELQKNKGKGITLIIRISCKEV